MLSGQRGKPVVEGQIRLLVVNGHIELGERIAQLSIEKASYTFKREHSKRCDGEAPHGLPSSRHGMNLSHRHSAVNVRSGAVY